VVKGTGPEFIAAKLAERDLRHRQQGTSRYLVEPNVKDGKGGLRDLHTLFWIAKYFYRVQSREELVKAGVFIAAAGLKNSAQAKRIVFDGPGRTVIDGPFAETRELVVGFSIWEVKDMDEAMAWVARCPVTLPDRPGEIEIRPFYEAEDLAEFMTPEELSAPRDGERGKLGVA